MTTKESYLVRVHEIAKVLGSRVRALEQNPQRNELLRGQFKLGAPYGVVARIVVCSKIFDAEHNRKHVLLVNPDGSLVLTSNDPDLAIPNFEYNESSDWQQVFSAEEALANLLSVLAQIKEPEP
jgi:hypothetical protein